MNDTKMVRLIYRSSGGKDADLLGEVGEPALRVAAAPGLAWLARDVANGVREERRAADEAAARVRLARQTAGYD